MLIACRCWARTSTDIIFMGSGVTDIHLKESSRSLELTFPAVADAKLLEPSKGSYGEPKKYDRP